MIAGRRVLLTADEGPGSLAAARGLRAAGYEVHVAVTRDDTYVARSRSVAGVERLPGDRIEPEAFAAAVAESARRLDVGIVLPGTEASLRALTGAEALFEPGVAVGVCSTDALDLATSKEAVGRLAADSGLATLPTEEVDASTLGAVAERLDFPAVVKSVRSVETRTDGRLLREPVHRVDTEADLHALLAADPERGWLVQKRVEGTLTAVGGVAWRGELICATHQVSPRIWPVGCGTSSFAITVAPDPDREEAVGRLLRLIGWSGVFGLQFLATADDTFAIDLNPRIYGSIGLAIAAGQNLPAIWAELLAGGRPAIAPATVGVRYRAEEDDFRSLIAAFRDGRRRHALAGLRPRAGTAHAVFSRHDPAPSLVSLGKARRALRI